MLLNKLLYIVKKIKYVIFLTIFILIAYYALKEFLAQSKFTDDAYIAGNIVPIYSTVNGFVENINYDTGEVVNAGQTIIGLNEEDYINDLELNRLNLYQKLLDFRLKKIDKTILENTKKSNELTADTSMRSLQRKSLLFSKGVYSKDEYESDYTKSKKNVIALKSDQESLSKIKTELGDENEKDNLQVKIALQKFKQSYFNYIRSKVCSPVSGVVAKRYIQPGTYVTTTQKLYDITLNQRWVEANFRETQLKHIRVGQEVEITSDVLGDSVVLQGYIYNIGSGAGNVFSILPPQNATGNWTKVVQRVPVKILLKNNYNYSSLPLGTSVRVKLKDTMMNNTGSIEEQVKLLPNPCYTNLGSLYEKEEEKLFNNVDMKN